MNTPSSRHILDPKRLTKAFALACALAAFAGVSLAQQLPSLPSVTVGHTSLYSPVQALADYQGMNLATSPRATTDTEITALARNLGNDPARIYWWIRNNVKLTPTFGLSKGARGAAIDLAGTSFDQAHLFVQLLRASGNTTAQYHVGTITVSGATFTDWFGVSDGTAAAQLLADGGIPASVSGSGAGMTVTMLHVWVTFTSNGQTYTVDPSYKTSTVTYPVANLAGGLNGSALVSDALVGAETNNSGGVAKVRHLNVANVWNRLQTASQSLLSSLRTDHPSASMDDIVGTSKIVPASDCLNKADNCPLGTGQTSLPYETGSNIVLDEIPNALRTTLRIYVDDIDTTVYADEIYAKPLVVQYGVPGVAWEGWRVKLDGTDIAVGQLVNEQGRSLIHFDIHHPYQNGYLSETVAQYSYNRELPILVVFGLGDVSPEFQHRLAARAAGVLSYFPQQVCYSPAPGDDGYGTCKFTQFDFDLGQRANLAGAWLAQFSRLADISGRMSGTIVQHHHSLALFSMLPQFSPEIKLLGCDHNAPVSYCYFAPDMPDILGSSQKVNISSAISATSRTNDAAARKTQLATLTSLASTLEGSVVEQTQQSPYPSSVAAKLDWLNRATLASGTDWIEYATPSNWTTAKANLLADWYPHWRGPQGGVPAPNSDPIALVSMQAEAYVNAGYSLVLPISSFLGPGYIRDGASSCIETSFGKSCSTDYLPMLERGGAIIGYTDDDSHIAYVVVRSDQVDKGGGGALFTNPDEQFKPEANATDKNGGAHSVTRDIDLRNGTLSLSLAPDIVAGTGPAPNSLSYQRIFRAGFGGGWSSNWDNGASFSGDGLSAMGANGPQAAAELIVALQALNYLAPTAQSTDMDKLQRHVIAGLVNMWWAERVAVNTAVVTIGPKQKTFTHLADGSYVAPAGDNSRLTATINRQFGGDDLGQAWYAAPISLAPKVKEDGSLRSGKHTNPCGTQKYGDLSQYTFAMIEPDATTATFTFFCIARATNPNNVGEQNSLALGRTGWHLSQLLYPNGVHVDLSYTSPAYNVEAAVNATNQPLLTQVTNSLGRSLTFQYGILPNGMVSTAGILTVTDNSNPQHPRSVSFDGLLCAPLTFDDTYGADVERFCQNIITASRDPMGHTTTYDYADDWDGGTDVQWAKVSRLTAIHLPGSSAADFTFAYDAQGRVQSVIDANGRTTNYLTANGRRGEVVDAMGASTTSIFDDFAREIRSIDQLGRVTAKDYDGLWRLTRTTLPEGNYTEQIYDVRSNVIETRQHPKPSSSLPPLVMTVAYAEGAGVWICANQVTCNKPVSSTNARGATSNYSWNGTTGQLTQVLLPADNHGNRPQSDYAYSLFTGLSLLTSKTVKTTPTNSVVTSFAYNTSNHYVPQSLTVDSGSGKLNITTTFDFDSIGNFIHADGPRTDVADVSDYIWDLDRRLVFSIGPDPDGAGPNQRIASRYTYNDMGLLTQTDKGNTTAANGSDFASYLSVLNVFDIAGNKVKEKKFANGNMSSPIGVTDFTYDAADRLLCTALRMYAAAYTSLPTYALSGQTLPNACVKGASAAFGNDRITKTIYDAAGQTRQILRAVDTPRQQTYASYKYSLNGKQLAVADADAQIQIGVPYADALNENTATAHQTNYYFDGFDRPTTTLFADNSYELLGYYDSNGVLCAANDNPCTRRNRSGQITTLTYDNLDRSLTKAVPAAGSVAADTVTWDYDLTNQVIALSDSQGHTLTSTYDNAGRLTASARVVPGLTGSQTIGHLYDAAGNRTRVTWPDGYYVTYAFDAAGRMTAANENGSAALANYSYDQLGRRAWVQYAGTAAKVSYSWSPEDDLLTLTHALPGQPHYLDFTDLYSPAHQIVSSEVGNPAYQFVPQVNGTDNYASNGLNQYSSVTKAGTANPIYHDKNGNLVCAGPACTTHDAPNAGTWFMTPPPAGGTWEYLYDPENRLVEARTTGTTASYAYDPQGRRAKKTVNGTATYFLDSGDDEIAEYDGSGSLLRRYVQGPGVDQPIAMVTAAGVKTFFHQDKIGSVVAMSDTSGAIVEGPYTYDAYGNCLSGGSPCSSGVPYRFTGRRYDPETGLYYYRARYYSAALGRFLQTDSIGYKDGINWYAYVGNDPTDRTDPTGLYKCGKSLTEGQCTEFTNAQNAAKTQLSGAIKELSTLKADLASGNLTAQDKAVASVVSAFMGDGAGMNQGSVGQLIGSATKMLGVLNNSMPAEFGGKGSDLARAGFDKLTLYNGFFESPRGANLGNIQRMQTVAHESAHNALNIRDTTLIIHRGGSEFQIGPYGQLNALSRAQFWPSETWSNPDSLTYGLGFKREGD